MDLAAYKKVYGDRDDAAPGWDAIDERLRTIYGERDADSHWGSAIPFMLGGPDPLHGVSAYWRDDGHAHYVSYGMSELWFNEEAFGKEFSQWGFEFTFRLALTPEERPPADRTNWSAPVWPASLMNNLARYVYKHERWFEAGHFIPGSGPIKVDVDTNLVGALFVEDPELGSIDTVHGRVEFLQMVGITQSELDRLSADKEGRSKLIESVATSDPMMTTDLARTSPYF